MSDEQSNPKLDVPKKKTNKINKDLIDNNDNNQNNPTICSVNKISSTNDLNNEVDVKNLLNLIEKQSNKYKSIKLLNNNKVSKIQNEENKEIKLNDNIDNKKKEMSTQTFQKEFFNEIITDNNKWNEVKENYKNKLLNNNYKIKKLIRMLKDKKPTLNYFNSHNLYEKKIKELKLYLSNRDLNYVSPVDGRRIEFNINRKINKNEIMKNRKKNVKSNSIYLIKPEINNKYDKFFKETYNSSDCLFDEIHQRKFSIEIKKLMLKSNKRNFDKSFYENELNDLEDKLTRTNYTNSLLFNYKSNIKNKKKNYK